MRPSELAPKFNTSSSPKVTLLLNVTVLLCVATPENVAPARVEIPATTKPLVLTSSVAAIPVRAEPSPLKLVAVMTPDALSPTAVAPTPKADEIPAVAL